MLAAGLTVLAGAALALTSVLVTAVLREDRPAETAVLLWLLSYGQVVLLSEVLSELRAIGAAGFALGGLGLLAAALALWRASGRPGLTGLPSRASWWPAVKRNPLLTVYAAAVVLLALGNLAWPFLYPPLDGDANAYHLPRAYFWRELGTARHFASADFRMNEFPPAPSFVHLWVLTLTRGFRGLHLSQWAAGLALSAATAALARRAGASAAGALFAALSLLTFPLVALQMGSAQTDLVAAATSGAAVLFGLGAVLPSGALRRSDIAGFGLAAGLAAGTKLTFGFLLPGLALGLATVAIVARTPNPARRLGNLAAAGLCGFVVLGAYNYVLNLLDFGNPVASPSSRSLFLGRPVAGTRTASALRYLYQTLDWPGLAASAEGRLPRMQREAFGAVARAAGVDLFGGADFAPVVASRAVPSEDRSGFGPVGFGSLAATPAVLVALLVLWLRRRRVEDLVGAILLGVALSWPAGFLLLFEWTAQKVRYFLVFLPLVVAVVLGRLLGSGRGRPIRGAVAIATGCAALVTGAATTALGPDGIRCGGYQEPGFQDRLRESVVAWLVPELSRRLPPGTRVGIDSEFNDTVFHLFRSLPGLHFVPLPEERVGAELDAGRIGAAVVGQLRDEAGQGITRPGVLLPRAVVSAPGEAALLRRSREAYGLRLAGDIRHPVAAFARQARLDEPGGTLLVRVWRAAIAAVDASGEGALLVLPTRAGAVPAAQLEASLRRRPLRVTAMDGALAVELPPVSGLPDAVYADLELRAPGGSLPRRLGNAFLLGAPVGKPGAGRAAGEVVALLISDGRLPLARLDVPFVRAEGFFDEENFERGTFRWTRAAAELWVPVPAGARPRALRVELLGFRDDARFRMTAGESVLFDGTLPRGALHRDFPLPVPEGAGLRIRLDSDTIAAPDGRQLGVCVKELTLLWEPSAT